LCYLARVSHSLETAERSATCESALQNVNDAAASQLAEDYCNPAQCYPSSHPKCSQFACTMRARGSAVPAAGTGGVLIEEGPAHGKGAGTWSQPFFANHNTQVPASDRMVLSFNFMMRTPLDMANSKNTDKSWYTAKYGNQNHRLVWTTCYFADTSANKFRFYTDQSTINFQHVSYTSSGEKYIMSVRSRYPMLLDTWYRITVDIRADRLELYVNGALQPQANLNNLVTTDASIKTWQQHGGHSTWAPLDDTTTQNICRSHSEHKFEIRDVRYYDSAAIAAAGDSVFTSGAPALTEDPLESCKASNEVFIMSDPCARTGSCFSLSASVGLRHGGTICHEQGDLRVCSITLAVAAREVRGLTTDDSDFLVPYMLMRKRAYCHAVGNTTQCSVTKEAGCYIYTGENRKDVRWIQRFGTNEERSAPIMAVFGGGVTTCSGFTGTEGTFSLNSSPGVPLNEAKALWRQDLEHFTLSR